MLRGSQTMRLAARYAPLAFGFCLVLALLGPGTWLALRVPAKTCKAWRMHAPQNLAATMRPATGPRTVALAPQMDAPLVMRLPAALQEPISGPALFVGSGRFSREAKLRPRRGSGAKGKAARAKAQKVVARLRLRSAGKGMSRLEYRVGQPMRPESVRLADRAQLRVMVPANSASIRRLKNYAKRKRGFSVKAKPLGASKLALHLSCDAHCELGTVQSFAKGWAVQVRHLDDPSLSLR